MHLSPDHIKQLWTADHYTPKGYLYHLLLAHRSPGKPWKIEHVPDFCQRWQLSERQFYQAKAALVAEDLIAESIAEFIELTALERPAAESSMPALGDLIADTLTVQTSSSSSEWATWFNEARQRGLVLASQRQGETVMVCTIDEQWTPFEQLKSQSWDDLEARLKPVVDDPVAEQLTPEQQSILAAMTRLAGG